MATPTLQDVLGAVPAVATAIDEMTELIPGVPSNKQNLEQLLELLDNQDGVQIGNDPDKPSLSLHTCNSDEEDGKIST